VEPVADSPEESGPASPSAAEAPAGPPRSPDEAPPGPSRTPRSSFDAGLRAGVPFALAGFFLSLSFGVLAREAGLSALAAVVMSAIVFAGSAQFAAIAIVAAGGGLGAAVGAAALMNSRFLPMGVALAPSLPGGPLKRALQGQTVIDSSWAMALQPGGRFDRWFLFGSTAVQYVTWFAGTLAGALGGDFIGDPAKLGLDAVYPTFFLALLLGELRDGRAKGVAAAGALIALALVPFAPPGVPVLVASVAAFAGLVERRAR
jgi:4-azaleucine resistance transporter AzlC